MNVYAEVRAAGHEAVNGLSIKPHEADSLSAVMAPLIEFLSFIDELWSFEEIKEAVCDPDFKYAGFYAAWAKLKELEAEYVLEREIKIEENEACEAAEAKFEAEGQAQMDQYWKDVENGEL